MTNVEFHLQLNHNDTWNMSRSIFMTTSNSSFL